MSRKENTVLVFSLEPWSDTWYSKQHYAAHLCATHEVYFVSVPDRWRPLDLFRRRVKMHGTPEGVHVVDQRNHLPLRILPAFLQRWILRINARRLSAAIPGASPLLWCFHPSVLAEEWKAIRTDSRIIYHVVDNYHHTPNDVQFARSSDLVVAINSYYASFYRPHNPRCIVVPHGTRPEDRVVDTRAAASIQRTIGPYLLLAASLSDHINYELLIEVAARFPRHRLLLLGRLFPMRADRKALFQRLLAMPNVSYEGMKHPDELRNYVRAASVGLVAYAFERTSDVPENAGRTPLKALTYLAQYCPVVATINSLIPELDGRGYFKAEEEAHYLDLIGEVIAGERPVDRHAVDRYMDSVQYHTLAETVLSELEGKREAMRA